MTRPLALHPLVQLVLARLREFVREPMAIVWVYGFPLIIAGVLGSAFRSEPITEFHVVVQTSTAGERVASALASVPGFHVELASQEECRRRLRAGTADIVLAAGPDGRSSAYSYIYDATRPGSVIARHALDDALQRAAGRRDVVQTTDRPVAEPGNRYIDFLVPGLMGLGLMGGGIWGVGFALVDMRMRQLLKRFVATPMRKSHFLAAILISRLLFMIPETAILLVFARVAFDVATDSRLFDVGVLVLLGAFEFAAIGLLVGSRAQTLETGTGIANLVMVPLWICSGVFFSSARFPAAIQPVIQALPLTPLIDALRQVMLEGAGLHQLGTELALISGWGVLAFLLALKLFRWG